MAACPERRDLLTSQNPKKNHQTKYVMPFYLEKYGNESL